MATALAERLQYEDELLISDDLYARSRVRDRLREETGLRYPEPVSDQDRRIYAAGNEAATRLVQAYLVRIEALAYGVMKQRANRYTAVEVGELISVGVEAAYSCCWAYDARGQQRNNPEDTAANAGRRFSSYATPHILRMMNRYVVEQSTPVSGNTDVIQATWKYKAAGEELAARLGRPATEAEIEAETGIKSDYIVANLPARSGVLDVDDVDSAADVEAIDAQVAAREDSEKYVQLLEEILRDAFDDDLAVAVFIALLGVDQGLPRNLSEAVRYLNAQRARERDRLAEQQKSLPKEQRLSSAELRAKLAELADLKRREVAAYETLSRDMLRHPQTRVRIARVLNKKIDEGIAL